MGRTSSKREFACKNDHRVTVKSQVIYCPTCNEPMQQVGDRFFDHLKIVDLHESDKSESGVYGNRYFTFNLSIGGIIVNGVTYSRSKRSVMMPRDFTRKKRAVRVYGTVAARIRAMVEAELGVEQSGPQQSVQTASS